MKEIELKVLSELIKNSRRSDRELARDIGSSQPTISRIRKRLEKKGYIKEYTMIPDYEKLGYEILAVTLLTYKKRFDQLKIKKAKRILVEAFKKGPYEIIMAERAMGAGYNAVLISIHQNYASFTEFTNWVQQFYELELDKFDSILINLAEEVHYKSLTFSSVAKHLLSLINNKR
jgi:DNA-binding Lrp family transcriptional regulator